MCHAWPTNHQQPESSHGSIVVKDMQCTGFAHLLRNITVPHVCHWKDPRGVMDI